MKEDTKSYEVDGLAFEFVPDGSPFKGRLSVVTLGGGFSAGVDLSSIRSRNVWAGEAAELYEADAMRLKRALNEVCALRETEVAKAAASPGAEAPDNAETLRNAVTDERIKKLVGSPDVLDRYVNDAAEIHGVVGEEPILKLQALVALGAQLAPYPNDKPAGANLIITAEHGRGKNHVCDAVASLLPRGFYLSFESASSKSLYYKAEQDPTILKHTWIYPNEAEATDQLVEMFRPLLSGGKAAHLTVNKDDEGRNAAQELNAAGPASITIPTMRNKLDGQLQSRMLVAELPDYEGRVAAHSREVSKLLSSKYAAKDRGPKIRAWQAALQSLTKIRRVVFDLDHDGFCFDSDTVSHGARLWANLLGLMLAHAWLEQRNRDTTDLESGERAVVAVPKDYEAAYDIFKKTCERSIVNLSGTHRAILDAVYNLKEETAFKSDGFSQRKIATRAGLNHTTVGEHKTFLTKSAKLLYEPDDGGLTLVADAVPDWWQEGELLDGFPRPEQVRAWWEDCGGGFAPKTAHHTHHSQNEARGGDTYAEKGGGHPAHHPPNPAHHPQEDDPQEDDPLDDPSDAVVGEETAVVDEVPTTENGIDKPDTGDSKPVVGMVGDSESGEQPTEQEEEEEEEI